MGVPVRPRKHGPEVQSRRMERREARVRSQRTPTPQGVNQEVAPLGAPSLGLQVRGGKRDGARAPNQPPGDLAWLFDN